MGLCKIFFFCLFFVSLYVGAFDNSVPSKLNEREISVLYYQGSYVPSKAIVFEGEKLILHFGNFSGTPQCLWSNSLDFFTSSYQGKVTSSVIEGLKAGTYTMNCPDKNNKNKNFVLTVLSKVEAKIEKKLDRRPSSVSQTDWVPRDEGDSFFNPASNNSIGKDLSAGKIQRDYNFQVHDIPDDYENYFEGGH